MSRDISVFYADADEENKGRAVVGHDTFNEMFIIDYYDNKGRHFFNEEFPNRSLQYVEDAAENWTLGIKKLA